MLMKFSHNNMIVIITLWLDVRQNEANIFSIVCSLSTAESWEEGNNKTLGEKLKLNAFGKLFDERMEIANPCLVCCFRLDFHFVMRYVCDGSDSEFAGICNSLKIPSSFPAFVRWLSIISGFVNNEGFSSSRNNAKIANNTMMCTLKSFSLRVFHEKKDDWQKASHGNIIISLSRSFHDVSWRPDDARSESKYNKEMKI